MANPSPRRRGTARSARTIAISGTAIAVVALALVVVQFVVARGARRRLEGELVQLRSQLIFDRHTGVSRIAAITAERQRLAEREARVAAELEGLRNAESALRAELGEARSRAAAGSAEVGDLRGRLLETQSRLRAFELDRSRTEQVIRATQGGVAFVEGGYGFLDGAGAPLRFHALDEKGEPVTDAEGRPLLSASGAGPAVRLRYTGTAFLVGRKGVLLTNRHVAEPWWRSAAADELAGKGYTPRLGYLRAYFPGVPAPFDLEVVALSDEADAAAVGMAPTPEAQAALKRLPVLPIDRDKVPPAAGQPIVLLGYPTGHDALLARLDEKVIRSILEAGAGDPEKVTQELARRGLIRPLATQGHLSDVLPGRFVYDAQTTLGGSGGPILDARGRVIGLNAAILAEFSGASFGVPIRFAAALLPAPTVPSPPPSRKRAASSRAG